MLMQLDWTGTLIGTALGFGLGMIWFSPLMFGRVWARGSHNLKPPESMPWGAMAAQLAATFLLAAAVCLALDLGGTSMAALVVLAAAALQFSSGLYGQKTPAAALVDGAFVAAMGLLMAGACYIV